jgi:hypothetical protein
VVHLAAHGSYNAADPLASAIVLAPSGADDGRLTVRGVYGLDLPASDLVVLSACETQRGQLSDGDEVVGLTRAFFVAGTPSVIATLWSVDDAPTALLMDRFYTHRQAGLGKAAALRQAQLDVRARYPNPYYWAGFVLSGDTGAVATSAPATRVPMWAWLTAGVLTAALVAAVVVFVIHTRRHASLMDTSDTLSWSERPRITVRLEPEGVPVLDHTVADTLLSDLLAQPARRDSRPKN